MIRTNTKKKGGWGSEGIKGRGIGKRDGGKTGLLAYEHLTTLTNDYDHLPTHQDALRHENIKDKRKIGNRMTE
jgi:hypothetical protein